MILNKEFIKENVKLVPIHPERDSQFLFELFQDKKMHTYTGNQVPINVNETKEMLEKYVANTDTWSFAIYDVYLNEFIGTYWIAIPVMIDNHIVMTADAQRIGVPFWRKEYTKKCRDLLYDFAFHKLNVDIIYAQAWNDHIASCQSMISYGFQLEKQIMKFNTKFHKMMKYNNYALTRNNFELSQNNSKKKIDELSHYE